MPPQLASVMILHFDRTLDPFLSLPHALLSFSGKRYPVPVQPADCSISISFLVLASYLLLSFLRSAFIAFHLVSMFILSFFYRYLLTTLVTPLLS